MRALLHAALLLGLAAVIFAFAFEPGSAVAEKPTKNLRILSKDMSRKEVKKVMKKMAKAVGKGCDDCHDLKAFEKDTKMKKTGRKMMRMTNELNARLKKAGFEKKIQCRTCHRGEEKPAR